MAQTVRNMQLEVSDLSHEVETLTQESAEKDKEIERLRQQLGSNQSPKETPCAADSPPIAHAIQTGEQQSSPLKRSATENSVSEASTTHDSKKKRTSGRNLNSVLSYKGSSEKQSSKSVSISDLLMQLHGKGLITESTVLERSTTYHLDPSAAANYKRTMRLVDNVWTADE